MNTFRSTIVLVYFMSVFTGLTNVAIGQSQRLGLPTGKFRIESKGQVARLGYCMDAGLPAPKAAVGLNHLLTDASQVEVVVGTRNPIPLATALQEQLIRIEAKSRYGDQTFDQLTANAQLPPGEVLDYRAIKEGLVFPGLYAELRNTKVSAAAPIIAAYQAKSKLDRREAKYLQYLSDRLTGGDGKHVVFVNTTTETVEVRIKEPAVVSETARKIHDIVKVIPEAQDEKQHREHQEELWRNNSALQAADSPLDPDTFVASRARSDYVAAYTRHEDVAYVLSRNKASYELRIVANGAIRETIRGAEVRARFSEVLDQKVASTSRLDTTFARVATSTDEGKETVVMTIGRQIVKLGVDDYRAFLAGEAKPDALLQVVKSVRDGSSLVLWRDPLRRLGSPAAQKEITTLTRRLQETLGDRASAYLDDDMEASIRRAATMPKLSSPGEVALVFHALAIPIEDYGVVDNVAAKFRASRIPVLRDVAMERLKDEIPSATTHLVVLTGHKDEAFREYFRSMAESGALKDKVVALFSCHAAGDEQLNSLTLRSDVAPKAVLFFDEEIHPSAVEDVLRFMAEELAKSDAPPSSLRQLLERSINRAMADPNAAPRLRPHLQKIKGAVIQISSLPPVLPFRHVA